MPAVPPDQCPPYPVSRKRRSKPTAAPSQDRTDGEGDGGEQQDEDAQHALPASSRRPPTPTRGDRAPTVHQRHGDRGSTDAAPAPLLPVYVRYAHLEAAGIVGSWTQLLRMIAEEDFPVGVLLSANVRAWRLDTITKWLEARPTVRKPVPPDAVHPRIRNKRRDERAAEEATP
jgi:hypothetical protein